MGGEDFCCVRSWQEERKSDKEEKEEVMEERIGVNEFRIMHTTYEEQY